MRRTLPIVILAGLPLSLRAQTCLRPGPDIVVSDIGSAANYAAVPTIDAFAIGTTKTNVGSAQVNYFSSSPLHPVEGSGMFRLRSVNGALRFEQVGMSWLFNGFLPLSNSGYCSGCIAGDGSHLGVSCSSPDTATTTGGQTGLSPRWQVNPHTGVIAFPPANPAHTGTVARRLQVATSDLDATSSYFAECLIVAADDATAGNQNDNASYRPVTISGGPSDFAMALSGATVPEQPAIAAWKAADPQVTETRLQVPGDGLLILSSKATFLGDVWAYEFALYNMNTDAGVGAFSVPMSISVGLISPGFHDVDYHDGDGENSVTRDGADWAFMRTATATTWTATPYAINHNGNGLLWGCLYNFRFVSSQPPVSGQSNITLWKTPGVVLNVAAQVPSSTAPCYPNCDNSTTAPVLNVQDFGCFLNRFAQGDPYANCDQSTTAPVLNVLDFSCFLNAFANGCS
jgi:hypothetical protein